MLTGTVTVNTKRVFGNTMYYPACPTAAQVCSLTGRKTLTESDVLTLSKMGVKVIAVCFDADKINNMEVPHA